MAPFTTGRITSVALSLDNDQKYYGPLKHAIPPHEETKVSSLGSEKVQWSQVKKRLRSDNPTDRLSV